MGLPATWTSAFGIVCVCGLSLVPMPATGMMTFMSSPSGSGAVSRLGKRLLETDDRFDRRGVHAAEHREIEADEVAEHDERHEPAQAQPPETPARRGRQRPPPRSRAASRRCAARCEGGRPRREGTPPSRIRRAAVRRSTRRSRCGPSRATRAGAPRSSRSPPAGRTTAWRPRRSAASRRRRARRRRTRRRVSLAGLPSDGTPRPYIETASRLTAIASPTSSSGSGAIPRRPSRTRSGTRLYPSAALGGRPPGS